MSERPDLVALREQARQGHEAEMKIAEYYDSLTFEELEAEFASADPVEVATPPEGIRVTFGVTFAGEDLHGLLKAVKVSGKTACEWIHDLVKERTQQ